jgi:hypothetical protein
MENAFALVDAPPPLKIDLGCGTQKKPGFVGADCIAFEGVDHVFNIGRDRWPWEDGSVSEAHSSHSLEHLSDHAIDIVDGQIVRYRERCHFFNELYRVMAPGAKATITTPYWASNRAYGDPTHEWPAICEMTYYYFDADWRKTQAPHACPHLTCDFKGTVWGYSLHPALNGRNPTYVEQAILNYKEAAQDMIATLTK